MEARCPLLAARCPLLAVHCPLLAAHCPLLAARCSLPTTHTRLRTPINAPTSAPTKEKSGAYFVLPTCYSLLISWNAWKGERCGGHFLPI